MQEVSALYTSLFSDTDKLKMALLREKSLGFRETGPGPSEN